MTAWDKLRDSLTTALRLQDALYQALVSMIVVGVGVAVVVTADPDAGVEILVAGGVLVFSGVFLWVKLRQLARIQRKLTKE